MNLSPIIILLVFGATSPIEGNTLNRIKVGENERAVIRKPTSSTSQNQLSNGFLEFQEMKLTDQPNETQTRLKNKFQSEAQKTQKIKFTRNQDNATEKNQPHENVKILTFEDQLQTGHKEISTESEAVEIWTRMMPENDPAQKPTSGKPLKPILKKPKTFAHTIASTKNAVTEGLVKLGSYAKKVRTPSNSEETSSSSGRKPPLRTFMSIGKASRADSDKVKLTKAERKAVSVKFGGTSSRPEEDERSHCSFISENPDDKPMAEYWEGDQKNLMSAKDFNLQFARLLRKASNSANGVENPPPSPPPSPSRFPQNSDVSYGATSDQEGVSPGTVNCAIADVLGKLSQSYKNYEDDVEDSPLNQNESVVQSSSKVSSQQAQSIKTEVNYMSLGAERRQTVGRISDAQEELVDDVKPDEVSPLSRQGILKPAQIYYESEKYLKKKALNFEAFKND